MVFFLIVNRFFPELFFVRTFKVLFYKIYFV